jgi:hypothetical protein
VLVGVADRGGAVAGAGFGEDPVDVGLDRVAAQEQLRGDLRVGQPTRDQPQDFRLALGQAVPARQRASAVIFTADYSEAAAINELGPGTGLPTAVSGHNSYWWWGPGNPRATTVLAVAPGPDSAGDYAAYLRQFFTSVRVVATLSNQDGIRNIEWGGHVYECTGPRQPWGQLWPRLRHYD